ncbi:MAG: OmpA family protein, partial [Actinomycetota bacterium]
EALQDGGRAVVGAGDGPRQRRHRGLEGFVANQGEADAAEAAAAAVEGIESVDNRLVLLEPLVETALTDGGVVDAGVAGVGTSLTVSGTLQSEDDRASVIAAAEGIEGVTEVVDELTVSVAADLNALPQVQFATASARILPESFADLDAAAELISGAENVDLRVEGYTDIIGDAAANRRLSAARANSVRDYLIGAGVDEAVLTAEGFGETQQFGEGNSDEALAANRLVRFVEIG